MRKVGKVIRKGEMRNRPTGKLFVDIVEERGNI